ncbi:hypothetical protein RIF29_16232 [Crotalaria pallida]|uniref:Reverse transcriptase domain-containing protein n=1 Tax=Crotalaria pallida TaxID=3830 RepID=A0AAN9IFD4_CROPI
MRLVNNILQYVDNAIMVDDFLEENAKAMKYAMRMFELCSGLKVNFNKSNLVWLHMEEAELSAASYVLRFFTTHSLLAVAGCGARGSQLWCSRFAGTAAVVLWCCCGLRLVRFSVQAWFAALFVETLFATGSPSVRRGLAAGRGSVVVGPGCWSLKLVTIRLLLAAAVRLLMKTKIRRSGIDGLKASGFGSGTSNVGVPLSLSRFLVGFVLPLSLFVVVSGSSLSWFSSVPLSQQSVLHSVSLVYLCSYELVKPNIGVSKLRFIFGTSLPFNVCAPILAFSGTRTTLSKPKEEQKGMLEVCITHKHEVQVTLWMDYAS